MDVAESSQNQTLMETCNAFVAAAMCRLNDRSNMIKFEVVGIGTLIIPTLLVFLYLVDDWLITLQCNRSLQ